MPHIAVAGAWFMRVQIIYAVCGLQFRARTDAYHRYSLPLAYDASSPWNAQVTTAELTVRDNKYKCSIG